MKKILSMCMALMLAISMTTTVFAQQPRFDMAANMAGMEENLNIQDHSSEPAHVKDDTEGGASDSDTALSSDQGSSLGQGSPSDSDATSGASSDGLPRSSETPSDSLPANSSSGEEKSSSGSGQTSNLPSTSASSILEEEGNLPREEGERLVVVYEPSVALARTPLIAAYGSAGEGIEIEDTFTTANTLASVVTITDGSSVEDKIAELEQNPQILSAEPNFRFELKETPVVTNDPLLPAQNYLSMVNAPKAWSLTRTNQKIRVAVIDTGMQANHPDLAANIAINYDATSNSHSYTPLSDHGSHVGGIIAGVADNGVGIAGVSYNASLLSVNVFYVDPIYGLVADYDAILRAIQFSVENGARVVNMSFGKTGGLLVAMENAMRVATEKGVVFVASAGNDGTNTPTYPSDSAYTISTVALQNATTIWPYSNYGPAKDIAAPGYEILSTVRGSSYQKLTGTSMASPMVSGIAALILSVNPNLTAAQVKDIIYNTAADLGAPGKDVIFGYGRIDALAAVKAANASIPRPSITLDSSFVSLTAGSSKQIVAKVTPTTDAASGVRWQVANPSIASVNANGVVSGIKAGSTAITATSVANGKTASCNITVYSNATQAFVARLYNTSMGRPPDGDGLAFWVNQLNSGRKTGAEVAHFFFNSSEFLQKNVSDKYYLDCLYNTLMDRKPDSKGKSHWLNYLNNGYGRNGILIQFAQSPEFKNICSQYGIAVGTLTNNEPRNQNANLTAFIYRLYINVLGRPAESNGLNFWASEAQRGVPLENIAANFVFSQEFEQKNYNNKEYLEILYRAFMGREADAVGLRYWLTQMTQGKTRQQVLSKFIYSPEFQTIKANFGL